MLNIALIAPFGKDTSTTRKRTDCVYRILEEICKKSKYEIHRSDLEPDSNVIKSIRNIIQNADVVIADISEKNPNVFYECGLRNAIRGKIVYISCEREANVPFDITQDRVSTYEYNATDDSIKNSHIFLDHLKERISCAMEEEKKLFFNLSTSDIATYFDKTILTNYTFGKKDHYALAKQDAGKKYKSIFLMQRSSSIVLGAERNWPEEKKFLSQIMQIADQCTEFCHVVTLEGIKDHFCRKGSFFPDFKNYETRLRAGERNAVELNTKDPNKHFMIKKLPHSSETGFYESDHQARVLIAEYDDGSIATVIVQNLGETQISFWAEGKDKLKKYLHDCIEYYTGLTDLTMGDIKELLSNYENVSKEINKR